MPEALKKRRIVGQLRTWNFESKSLAFLSRSWNVNLEPQTWNQDLWVSSMYVVGERRLGVLGLFWAVLGPSWAVMGPSWAVFGLSWGPLGPSWADLGGLLGNLGALEARKGEKANIRQKPKENK